MYSLPKINTMLDKFNSAAFFSTIDLTVKFWQLKIDPESRKKTAFITKYGTRNTSGNCKNSLRENPRQQVDFSSASEKEYMNTQQSRIEK
ncbi:hypothetical protein G9A89_014099 [Geosiphon pyriformis]|nr:hypothetical protein G9A89_014099 [Geosiphon pyriformis]